jgi:PAS domain S-box-containing protein
MSALSVEETGDEGLRVAFRDVVKTISLALEMDERGKLNHASRVALLAYHVGLAVDPAEAGPLYYAGLLHDLGAVGLEDHVVHQLSRETHISDEVRSHPERGARIVRPITVLRPYEQLIRDHRERWDGSGFPNGKQGGAISVGASIIHLSDRVELGIRAAPRADLAERVTRLVRSERGQGVPARVADATLTVLFGRPSLLEVLADDEALEAASSALCPPAPGLEHVTRWELLSQLLWVLARVVDAKHAYTMGHSTRVAHLAYRIVGAMSDDVNAWDVAWAGLLHDVGKVGVPRKLLDKPGELDATERRIVQGHAADSERIISTIRGLSHLALPAASHHERYDGKGYPRGLSAEGIPLIGRILSYSDIYDGLTSSRAYRSPLSHPEALSRIRSLVGTALDPHLAEAACGALARWGQSGPKGHDAMPFSGFFESDDADLDTAFGPEAGSGTLLRASPRGTVLANLEPWTRIELGPDLAVRSDMDAFRRLTTEVGGRDLASHLDGDSMRALRSGATKLSRGESFTQYMFTLRGKPLEVLVSGSAGAIVLLCRSAENRLQSMERLALFYRNFLSSSEAVVFADTNARIVDANESFLSLFGYRRDEVVGQSTRLLNSGRQDQGFYRALWEALNDPARGSWSGDLVDRKRSGEELDVHLSIESVRDPNGVCIGYLSHIVDISARKRMEAELRARQAELIHANEELSRVSRFKDDLIAMTSHDLRGPLGAIMNLADLVREGLPRMPEAQIAASLERIRDTAGKLSDLVNDLLDLEKAESGTFELRLCRVRLDTAIAHCVERAKSGTVKQLRFQIRTEGTPCYVIADPVRLEQILLNLLGNAAKFTPDGAAVVASIVHDAARDRYVVRIDDEGPGIPDHAIEAIFDRFYQVKTKSVTMRGFGTGLGLNIVQKLVHLHGGTVWAENRAEGGCRFSIELPARSGDPRLAQPVAMVLARCTPRLDELSLALSDAGFSQLCVESATTLRSTCALTDADVLLYDDALADPDARRFIDGLISGDALPVPVRLLEEGDPYPCAGERSLFRPALPSELREFALEANRRRAGFGERR